MAIVRLSSNNSVVFQFNSATDFQAEPDLRKSLRVGAKLPMSRAQDVAAQLRAIGVSAYVASDDGQRFDATPDPTSTAPEPESFTWRGITPEKIRPGYYIHRFVDSLGANERSVAGTTPLEVIQKLRDENAHPLIKAYLKTLEDEQVTTPAAEAPAEPEAPLRILRPGDQSYSELPERRVEPQNAGRATIDFDRYVDSLSSAELREKMKDPQFVEMMNRTSGPAWKAVNTQQQQ